MKLAGKLPFLVVVAVLGGGFAVMLGNFNTSSQTTGATGATGAAGFVVPELSDIAQAGKTVFDANCLACHGSDGTGSDMGPPLVHKIYNPGHHNDMSFFRAGRQGTPQHHWTFGDMPSQPQVTDEEMAAIIRYIREMQEANGIVTEPHVM